MKPVDKEAPTIAVISMYEKRQEIYPREVSGRFAKWRWVFVWLTQLFFYCVPWMTWNDRQAVLFDLVSRKFYIFGLVFLPHDFIYLTVLLIISALSLFLFTAVAGRLWCGYSCPQTVYTEIFLWIERKFEGTRSARMRLDKQPWNAEKILRKGGKHLAWGTLALWTGFTFVGYFTPILVLTDEVLTFTLGPWESFWILFYGFATYGNAGWLREQVCRYMCPYARFQSVMLDKDSMIITYDRQRGEPRGAHVKGKDDAGKGACIDCSMCVQVCPTGIDIRNGLQFDCIGCAACIDACDMVMDKVGAPRGLVRYSTENAMAKGWSFAEIRKRILRPRILIYTVILWVIIAAFTTSLSMRVPVKMEVVRDRAVMGREADDGMLENVYRIQIMNTDEKLHVYRLDVSGMDTISLLPDEEIAVDAVSARTIPVTVRVAWGSGQPGSNEIVFELRSITDESVTLRQKAAYYLPAQ